MARIMRQETSMLKLNLVRDSAGAIVVSPDIGGRYVCTK